MSLTFENEWNFSISVGVVLNDGPVKPINMMYQCADCTYWSLVIDELLAHHAAVHPEME